VNCTKDEPDGDRNGSHHDPPTIELTAEAPVAKAQPWHPLDVHRSHGGSATVHGLAPVARIDAVAIRGDLLLPIRSRR
jgi:hypothetical protein